MLTVTARCCTRGPAAILVTFQRGIRSIVHVVQALAPAMAKARNGKEHYDKSVVYSTFLAPHCRSFYTS